MTAYVTLREAAERLSLSEGALRGLRRRGRWDVVEDPNRRGAWLYAIDEDQIETTEDRPVAEGRPRIDVPQPAERRPPLPRPTVRQRQPRRDAERPRVAAVCSDVHIPDHDHRAWTGFLDLVRDLQPDEVILAGDILELESCSSHGGVVRPALFVEEMDAGRRELRRVRAAAPDAEITYLEGNHETRLSRLTTAIVPTISGAIDVPTQLGLADLGIRWRKEGEPHPLGRLSVVHGWYANKHHAAKHTETMGCSVLYGHTHKPQMHIAGTAGGVRGGFGNGCLRTLEPAWMTGRPTGWMHGFSVVHVWPDGEFQVTPLLLTPSRRFAYGGRHYGG